MFKFSRGSVNVSFLVIVFICLMGHSASAAAATKTTTTTKPSTTTSKPSNTTTKTTTTAPSTTKTYPSYPSTSTTTAPKKTYPSYTDFRENHPTIKKDDPAPKKTSYPDYGDFRENHPTIKKDDPAPKKTSYPDYGDFRDNHPTIKKDDPAPKKTYPQYGSERDSGQPTPSGTTRDGQTYTDFLKQRKDAKAKAPAPDYSRFSLPKTTKVATQLPEKINKDGSKTHKVQLADGTWVTAGETSDGRPQYTSKTLADGTKVHEDFRSNKIYETRTDGTKITKDRLTGKVLDKVEKTAAGDSIRTRADGRQLKYRRQQISGQDIQVYQAQTYRHDYTNDLFWWWMLNSSRNNTTVIYSDGSGDGGSSGSSFPTYGNGGVVLETPAKPIEFSYDWKRIFAKLPDSIPTKKLYKNDGVEWISDYTTFSVFESNFVANLPQTRGWLFSHIGWRFLPSHYGKTWEQLGYFNDPQYYNMGGGTVAALLKNQVRDIVQIIGSDATDDQRIAAMSVQSVVDATTNKVTRENVYVIGDALESYDLATNELFGLRDGDIIQLVKDSEVSDGSVQAKVLYSYNVNKAELNAHAGKVFYIKLSQLQFMQDEVNDAVDRGLQKAIEEAKAGKINLSK